MAKVCGIDISGSEAVIVALEGGPDNFSVIKTDFKKIGINDYKNQADVQSFRDTIIGFFNNMGFDRIGIKERNSTGTRSGGTITFKIEGLIQTSELEVKIVHHATIRSKLRGKNIDLSKFDLNKYQYEAFETAFSIL